MTESEHVCLSGQDLIEFRTKQCPLYAKGTCSNSSRCNMSHSETWPRRNPLQFAYDYKLCPNIQFFRTDNKMQLQGKCNYGRRCKFSHSKEEQLYHPDLYKTRMCMNYPNCKGYYCPFAHSQSELRQQGIPIVRRGIDRPKLGMTIDACRRQVKAIKTFEPNSTILESTLGILADDLTAMLAEDFKKFGPLTERVQCEYGDTPFMTTVTPTNSPVLPPYKSGVATPVLTNLEALNKTFIDNGSILDKWRALDTISLNSTTCSPLVHSQEAPDQNGEAKDVEESDAEHKDAEDDSWFDVVIKAGLKLLGDDSVFGPGNVFSRENSFAPSLGGNDAKNAAYTLELPGMEEDKLVDSWKTHILAKSGDDAAYKYTLWPAYPQES
ncbi:hypothetical protein BEWA_027400 [Theileria equi strain WA]|uniref:C3H1-type domain-containing protein n=1 Tax=Theileria equi strain WA TaxID=1537102 RepID=L0AY22_THEEQ|nr:hypothetical protein BEWA_027400 [Theileria equi strain WA]AFZ79891.1 hypothetical protein BEWA_027400 [Theileria equi strain WA]|eukprot:XP_004829557.1 hypothetical protein BEWA_027400 [Theileria equi strain WA]